MRTEDLIDALVRDARSGRTSFERTFAFAETAGIVVAVVLFISTLGLRADFAQAIVTPWYALKLSLLLATAALAIPVVAAFARPGAEVRSAALIVPVALLGLAVVADLAVLGVPGSLMRLQGKNAVVCLLFIPFFAAAPLVATLIALRDGAPVRPVCAGLAAGLLSGAIGGLLYGLYCPDDSPLFVAVWYPIGISLMAAVGGLAGRFLLRW